MITSINKSNAGRYTALFEKATKALRNGNYINQDWAITDLESYFSNIKNLLTIDKKYTILPIDEDYFEIDANSRSISIPNSFRKNGIAVEGDEIAEIVYFRVNRYFDFMDLNNADIFIQWETDLQSGVSKEWVRDIESDPDYLIFGWPIDSRITAQAGTIKFQVRFIMWDDATNADRKITYNLSTLTTQVVVNPGLAVSASDLVASEEYNEMIQNRLKDTEITGSSIPDTPEFLVGLEKKEIDLGGDGTVTLLVQAYAPDAGAITYAWRKNSLNAPDISKENGADIAYIETEDETAQESKSYYLGKTIDEITSYAIITDLTVGENVALYEEQHGGKVYERFGKLIVSSVGDYYAVAKNRVNASTASAASGPVTIPGPKESTIVLNTTDFIMDADNQYEITLSPEVTNTSTTDIKYQWIKDGVDIEGANKATYTVKGDGVTKDKQGKFALRVTATRNKVSIDNTNEELYWVTYAAQAPTNVILTADYYTAGEEIVIDHIVFDNDYYDENNTYSYQWYRVKQNGEKTAISGATNAAYQTSISQGGEKIQCGVKNNYNGTISEEAFSTIIVLSAADVD